MYLIGIFFEKFASINKAYFKNIIMKYISSLIILFFFTVTAIHADPPQAKTPTQIHFNTLEHNFGNLPQGKPVSFEFEFTNQSSEPLLLEDVKASCGCTTPTWTKEPVMPQKTGIIKAQYNMAREGAFKKSITVTTKSGENVMLYISGNAITQEQGVNKTETNMLGGSGD